MLQMMATIGSEWLAKSYNYKVVSKWMHIVLPTLNQHYVTRLLSWHRKG
ncbi:hypothetical protein VCR14J2_300279 [Vibrio coralliirubri]|uniref:Uncharacterized protein n=1 Tax=Vibrio coralliirubri TaxID=1516159 RepID=A0AA86X0J8_9VIBR|nr:hypothetical protein VCR31J2_1280289 [Vibrio coralliirubri]CDU02798.1 hypothetical protein VCR14J2_300279 [Vibrio coralliirubri]